MRDAKSWRRGIVNRCEDGKRKARGVCCSALNGFIEHKPAGIQFLQARRSSGFAPSNMSNPGRPRQADSQFPPREGSRRFHPSPPPISRHSRAGMPRSRRQRFFVRPEITGFSKPSAQVGRLRMRRRDNADRHLGGAAIVGTIVRDCIDRIAAHTSLGLFLEPFPWLPAQFHRIARLSWFAILSGLVHGIQSDTQ